LAPSTEHVGKVAKRAGLLPCGINELLRTAGLSGGFAEPGQERWYHSTDRGLYNVAIKTERDSNAPDHFGCQELIHE